MHSSNQCYKTCQDHVFKHASSDRNWQYDAPYCQGERAKEGSGRCVTAGHAMIMVAVGPLSVVQPKDITDAFPGDGGIAAAGVWPLSGTGTHAGPSSGRMSVRLATTMPVTTAADTLMNRTALQAASPFSFLTVTCLVLNLSGFFVTQVIRMYVCLCGFVSRPAVLTPSFPAAGMSVLSIRCHVLSCRGQDVRTVICRTAEIKDTTKDLPWSIPVRPCYLQSC